MQDALLRGNEQVCTLARLHVSSPSTPSKLRSPTDLRFSIHSNTKPGLSVRVFNSSKWMLDFN